ncbi:hypothetical protein AciX9_0284 [Granulicella tundricola MP5ACTX9]|uniref:Uncharacterized protein n=1 Tax=Granulicella tundricola (strain ATCC BAA-1859 / DSM 23138 / MP5ACTX9) TaxID=1198114 RepID=E8WW50_GRATM|nr:hypothetical protein AciX9_0284 [Granulicella tundricola MP5ACTX9]
MVTDLMGQTLRYTGNRTNVTRRQTQPYSIGTSVAFFYLVAPMWLSRSGQDGATYGE